MIQKKQVIHGIPSIIWGKPAEKVFIHVHGKLSRKEYAENFACLAEKEGYQTVSFDLPEHGDRSGMPDRCDIWNGKRDLELIACYVFQHWPHVSLFACSLGAYFSLQTYADKPFESCLFLSPIVDMKWLVESMMSHSKVTPGLLREKQEIYNEVDPLRWDYYCYIQEHPVQKWPFRTSILYGALDTFQPIEIISAFTKQHNCSLTVSPSSQHPFMEKDDFPLTDRWIQESLRASANQSMYTFT